MSQDKENYEDFGELKQSLTNWIFNYKHGSVPKAILVFHASNIIGELVNRVREQAQLLKELQDQSEKDAPVIWFDADDVLPPNSDEVLLREVFIAKDGTRTYEYISASYDKDWNFDPESRIIEWTFMQWVHDALHDEEGG